MSSFSFILVSFILDHVLIEEPPSWLPLQDITSLEKKKLNLRLLDMIHLYLGSVKPRLREITGDGGCTCFVMWRTD